jgi:hypothetical protein
MSVFRVELRSVLEFGFKSEGKMQKIIILLRFYSVDRTNQIQKLDVLTCVLAWSWWDVTLCFGWVVPNILNYRGAFTYGIKNASRPFEMLESTHPTTQHHIPEHLSVHNIFHLSRVERIEENTWITGFYSVKGICVYSHPIGFLCAGNDLRCNDPHSKFPETCRKRAPLLVEGTVFQIDVWIPNMRRKISEEWEGCKRKLK